MHCSLNGLVGYVLVMHPTQVKKMEEKKISAIGMDMIPRQVSRAQSFDALSSMANVAGYR